MDISSILKRPNNGTAAARPAMWYVCPCVCVYVCEWLLWAGTTTTLLSMNAICNVCEVVCNWLCERFLKDFLLFSVRRKCASCVQVFIWLQYALLFVPATCTVRSSKVLRSLGIKHDMAIQQRPKIDECQPPNGGCYVSCSQQLSMKWRQSFSRQCDGLCCDASLWRGKVNFIGPLKTQWTMSLKRFKMKLDSSKRMSTRWCWKLVRHF